MVKQNCHFPFLDAVGGVRVENTEQGFTLNTFYPTGINGINKNYTDILPSVDLKFKLNPMTNLRATYYNAIARPNYYDLVPGTTTEYNLRHHDRRKSLPAAYDFEQL